LAGASKIIYKKYQVPRIKWKVLGMSGEVVAVIAKTANLKTDFVLRLIEAFKTIKLLTSERIKRRIKSALIDAYPAVYLMWRFWCGTCDLPSLKMLADVIEEMTEIGREKDR